MSAANVVVARMMVGAELLKLRRNRMLVLYALLLTSGIVALSLAWIGLQRSPGGVSNFEIMMRLLGSYFGPVAAVLIGVEAGAGDRASGVLRDLIVTGRSRTALFAARVPGALLLLLPLLALAFAIALPVAHAAAGDLPAPSASLALKYALWLALACGVTLVVSVGVAALLGARAVAGPVLIAWFAVACPLLASIGQLDAAREALPLVALEHLKPGTPGTGTVATTTPMALVVLALWCAAACALGAWRTRTQDA